MSWLDDGARERLVSYSSVRRLRNHDNTLQPLRFGGSCGLAENRDSPVVYLFKHQPSLTNSTRPPWIRAWQTDDVGGVAEEVLAAAVRGDEAEPAPAVDRPSAQRRTSTPEKIALCV